MMLTDEFLQKAFQILVFAGALLAASGTFGVWHYTKKINSKSSAEIRSLLNKNNELISGGDGYCYVMLFPDKDGTAKVWLFSGGETSSALYSVKISIHWTPFIKDIEAKTKTPELREKFLNSGEAVSYHVELPEIREISPRLTEVVGQINWQGEGLYTISFDARNGDWFQEYRYKESPDRFQFKVIKGSTRDGKVLLEKQSSQW